MSSLADLITALDTASDTRKGLTLSPEQVAIITGNTTLLDDLKAIQEGGLPSTLTLGDICTDLQVSRQTIWRLRSEGSFPSPVSVIGRTIRFDRTAYVRWKLARHAA